MEAVLDRLRLGYRREVDAEPGAVTGRADAEDPVTFLGDGPFQHLTPELGQDVGVSGVDGQRRDSARHEPILTIAVRAVSAPVSEGQHRLAG